MKSWGLGKRQLAQLMLDNNLPGRGDAQVNLIARIGKDPAGGFGQLIAARYDPEERACFQKDVHVALS